MSESGETRTYRLSRRLRVDITVGPGSWCCLWDPAVPERFTKKEITRYLRARREMLQRLADMTGKTFVLADVGNDGEVELAQVIQPLP
jgi:hypothetical protein